MNDDALAENDSNTSEQSCTISMDLSFATHYSPAARRALQSARSMAETTTDPIITSDRLLIALLDDPTNAATRTLIECGIDSDRIVSTIAFVRGSNVRSVDRASDDIHSPRVKRVLANAMHEATTRESEWIDTLHLLTALVRERQGIALFALEAPGRNLENIETSLVRAIQDGVTDPS